MAPLTIRCNYNVSNSLIGSTVGHVVSIGDFDKIFAFAAPIRVENILQSYGFNGFFCIFVVFRCKKRDFVTINVPDLLSEKNLVSFGDFDKIFALATPILVQNILQSYGFNSFF